MVTSTIKAGVAAGVYFGVLKESKLIFSSFIRNEQTLNAAASLVARLAQSVLTNPFYVIKTRFEVIGFNEYSSVSDAVRKILRQEGVRGFFTGLYVSILRDLPFSGLYYPLYEESKKAFAYSLGMQALSEDAQNDKLKLLKNTIKLLN